MSKADSPTKTCHPCMEESDRVRPMRAKVDGVPMCSSHYNRARYTPEQRHQPRTVNCHVCGEATTKNGGYGRRAVCSYYCRWFLQNPVLSCPVPASHPAHPDYRPPLPVLWRPPEPKPSTRRWVAGNCHRCGEPYVAEDYTDTARFCSVRCGKRVRKQRYRARKKEAYVADVSPSRIYERDGWRCQLCRRKVRRDKTVPHPLAPVLDHIIPLAAGVENGGVHAPHNVQCAHFMCNSIKSDRVASAVQLLLVG